MRYAEVDYEAGLVTEYERQGTCTQCGDCCRALIRFSYAGVKPDTSEYERKAGGPNTDGAGKWQGYEDDSGWHWIKLLECVPSEKTCCALAENGQCSSYQDRNPYCRVWPLAPTDLANFPQCGFSFTKLHEWRLEPAAPGGSDA